MRCGARGRCITPFGITTPLARLQIDRSTFDIDQQASFYDVEELIILIVLVPMVFAFHHCQPHNRVVHLAKRLVVPLVLALVGQGFFVDQLQRLVQDVEVYHVREFLRIRGHYLLLFI